MAPQLGATKDVHAQFRDKVQLLQLLDSDCHTLLSSLAEQLGRIRHLTAPIQERAQQVEQARLHILQLKASADETLACIARVREVSRRAPRRLTKALA